MCTVKGVAGKNHDEHETFLPGLVKFDELVKGVKDGGKEYDGGELGRLIEEFGPKLEAHLRSEIELLLSLEADEGIDWDLLGKTMAAHSKKVADRVSPPTSVLLGPVTDRWDDRSVKFLS